MTVNEKMLRDAGKKHAHEEKNNHIIERTTLLSGSPKFFYFYLFDSYSQQVLIIDKILPKTIEKKMVMVSKKYSWVWFTVNTALKKCSSIFLLLKHFFLVFFTKKLIKEIIFYNSA